MTYYMNQGFAGKVTKHSSGLYLRIPEHNIKYSDLEHQDLLHLKITSKTGQSTQVTRKIQITGNQAEVYLPKKVKEDLDLVHGDRVAVLYEKD